MTLTPAQKALHQKAISLCLKYRYVEFEILEVLVEIGQTKLHKKLSYPSLFKYCLAELGLTESLAYAFIAVARKCTEVPKLREALKENLSVSRASRLVAAINSENADELISFARSHSGRALDFEVARINPKAKVLRESVKVTSSDQMRITVTVSKELYEKIKRAESLLEQKGHEVRDLETNLRHVYGDYLSRHDPVCKAERARKRDQKREQRRDQAGDQTPKPQRSSDGESTLCNRVAPKPQAPVPAPAPVPVPSHRRRPGHEAQLTTPLARVPLTAGQKHATYRLANGRCTFIDASGNRCAEDRYLHIHHLKPVSLGGGNEPSNLTLLCSFHHDLVHQLSFAIEGQVNWIRSPERRYVA